MRKLFIAALAVTSIAFVVPSIAPGKPNEKRGGEKKAAPKTDKPQRSGSDRARDEARFDRDDSRPTTSPSTQPADGRRDDREGGRTQGEQATQAIREQRQLANSLRDRYGDASKADPAIAAKEIQDARSRLDAENARHGSRLAELRRDEQAALDAGDKKQFARARKAIEAERESHEREAGKLDRRLRELEGKADGALKR